MDENARPIMPSAAPRFGFSGEAGSTHLARSYMLAELQTLLAYTPDPETTKARYRTAVIDENCLGKQSGQTRKLTYRHLRRLYALDPAVPIFQALRYFWARDPDGQPLLYATLLDCPIGDRYNLAGMAAQRAWLVMRRISDVVEVSFPALITELHRGWFRE
ncbi:MAG: hypothetical protein NTV69_19140 [Caldilinea sp.]|nr:hypothetical protein [Caldilinea sp.]